MGDYRKVLNAIGFSQLAKPIDIPDYHLMVGVAEELSSQPITVFSTFTNGGQKKPTALPNETVDDNDHAIGMPTVSEIDFPNTFYLGSPLGGD